MHFIPATKWVGDGQTVIVMETPLRSGLPHSGYAFRLQIGAHFLPSFEESPAEPGAPV